MIKNYKIILSAIIIFLLLIIFYLSMFGVSTSMFNNAIKAALKQSINADLILKEVYIKLNLRNFTTQIETKNVKIEINKNSLKLDKIVSEIPIINIISKKNNLTNIYIKSNQNNIKNLINFFRQYNNNFQITLLNKFINKGKINFSLYLNFDQNGKILDNYLIESNFQDLNISLLNNKNLDTNFFLTVKKDFFEIKDAKFQYENVNFISKLIKIKKNENNFYNVKGDIYNPETNINVGDLKKYFKNIPNNILSDRVIIRSQNNFEFYIDKRFKIKDIKVRSKLNIEKLLYKLSNKLFKEILNVNNNLEIFDTNLDITYETSSLKQNNIKFLSLTGNSYLFENGQKDKIQYQLTNQQDKVELIANINIYSKPILLNLINFEKKENINSSIKLKLTSNKNRSILFNKILLKSKKDEIYLEDLRIKSNNQIENFKKIELNFTDKSDLQNNLIVKAQKKNYLVTGSKFNASKIIDHSLKLNSKNNLFVSDKNNIFKINIEKVYIDKKNYIKNLKGDIEYKNNKLNTANLISFFPNGEKFELNINETQNNEIVTQIFTRYPKPFVQRYKFIDGFDEGVLNFQSVKIDNISSSVLIIDNFKVKKVPVLAKILALASLQGIADTLTGEGIRFTDFEMKFNVNDGFMKIEEIYAIGPAISLMMEGYIDKKNLVSLRGTLVPATTINRTISSIPVLGDILVGNKVGEGVFGVSFKIKGQGKDLKTSVNPIKTLAPRFITRTLDKLKKK